MNESIEPLVLDALREALTQRPGVRDLVHHSDRGSQYASHDYRDALDEAGIMCSMSRRGNCWANAVSDSFFGTLKTELLYELPLQTRGATRHAVADCIENFYNVRRRYSSLDYVSPVEFELKHPRNGGSASIPGVGNQEACTITEMVFTMAETGVHNPEMTVHDHRNGCSRSSEINVHDKAKWVFTMVRNTHRAGAGCSALS